MNWRVKTCWFSESPKYHYFKTKRMAKNFIDKIAEPQQLWWVLEKRQ